MNEEAKYKLMYENVIRYANKNHLKNQHRITVGLRCLIIIPIVLLVMMFTIATARIAFLLIWITSLLTITSVLVYIEYSDHKMQRLIHLINGDEEMKIRSLTEDKFEVAGNIKNYIKEKVSENQKNSTSEIEAIISELEKEASEKAKDISEATEELPVEKEANESIETIEELEAENLGVLDTKEGE